MKPQFNGYATRAVPRYTSYPTVPHFTDEIQKQDYASWLAELDPSDPLSLYLHVPFCRQICWYCGCNMKLASKEAPILQYAHDLMQEVHLLAEHLPSRMKCQHLHWGGGTPTALSPNAVAEVMEAVVSRFDFVPGAEIAIESDPRTLTEEMIQQIGALGFNRASFGVQEFDEKVQAAINRIQPPDMVEKAVDGLRNVGVNAINFDLIYGLPHQTEATLANTIEVCAKMRPDRIALFGYAHVPWMAKKQRMIDETALPGASERIAQAQMAAQAIIDAGYVAIGLDHFALPSDELAIAATEGSLRRNFQGYTTDEADTLLGLGATSIGRTPSGYIQNISETGAWARCVRNGNLPIAKGISLSADDMLRAHVIEALMCQGEVDLDKATDLYGASPDWYGDAQYDLDQMEKDGLIVREGSVIRVEKEALPLVRVVASVFDAYLNRQTAKHSIAV